MREHRPKTQPPPNYASRAFQYRLMVHVGMLMVVILLMVEAAKPKNWEWMWKLDQQQNPSFQDDSTPIDTRLKEPSKTPPSFSSDSFVAKAEVEPFAMDANDIGLSDVPSELFANVKDNMHFRPEEAHAWFHLFDLLKQNSNKEIQRNSIGKVGYPQLFRQTHEYRGKIVQIDGTIRRLKQVEAPKNNVGIESYWQCTLNPNDGSNSPIIIYSLEIPEGLEGGDDVREDATFVGFCYKRWAYQTVEGPMLAPVLLAKSPSWTPAAHQSKEPQFANVLKTLLWLAIAAAVLGTIIAMVVFTFSNWQDKRNRSEQKRRLRDLQAAIGQRTLPTIQDSLRDMEKES